MNDSESLHAGGIITRLEVQQKRKNRCSVYIDDEFAFGIAIDLVVQFGLKKGTSLSATDIKTILLEESKRNAKDRAIRFLSFRDRSEKEIRDKLKTLKIDAAVIDWVMDELKRLKLVDDGRFATAFAKGKMASKPMGEYLLRREMSAKGLSDKYIETAIEQINQEHDPYKLAMQLAEKQLKKQGHVDAVKAKKRVSDFLLRRGFNWDIIHDVLDKLHVNDDSE
ncbi:RecX family transcriptional regulator [candidate division KSB1 bacterium]|nr:RecX family transcriptional regulator [candidate division KSB1 bacterium]